jgi:hypothetical protein
MTNSVGDGGVTVGRRWGGGGFGHRKIPGESAYSRRISTLAKWELTESGFWRELLASRR